MSIFSANGNRITGKTPLPVQQKITAHMSFEISRGIDIFTCYYPDSEVAGEIFQVPGMPGIDSAFAGSRHLSCAGSDISFQGIHFR